MPKEEKEVKVEEVEETISIEEFQLLKKDIEKLQKSLESKELEYNEAISERDGLHDELNAYRISGMTREEQLEAEKSELESELRAKEDILLAKEKEVLSLKSDVERERLVAIKEKILREYPDVLPEWVTASDELSMRVQAKKAVEYLTKLVGSKKALETRTKEEQEKIDAEELKTKEALAAAEALKTAGQIAETSSPGSAQEQVPAELKELETRYDAAREAGDVSLSTKLRLELSKFKGRQILDTN
jgi:hypothetical protein